MGRVAGKKAFITGAAQGLGEATARMLARNYGSAKAFVKAMLAARDIESKAFAELDSIDGIGDVVAREIAEFFAEAHNREEIERLLDEIAVEEAMILKKLDRIFFCDEHCHC